MDKTYNVKKIFGYNLRSLRESKSLTQEKLAEFLNLQSYQTINRIENAKSFVTSDLLDKICEFFNVEPSVLFHVPNQMYTKETTDKISQIDCKLDKIYSIVSGLKNKI